MGYFVQCPTCGNTTEGDKIMRCSCGHVSCDRCKSNPGFMDNSQCPVCGNRWYGGDRPMVLLGEIRPLNRD